MYPEYSRYKKISGVLQIIENAIGDKISGVLKILMNAFGKENLEYSRYYVFKHIFLNLECSGSEEKYRTSWGRAVPSSVEAGAGQDTYSKLANCLC